MLKEIPHEIPENPCWPFGGYLSKGICHLANLWFDIDAAMLLLMSVEGKAENVYKKICSSKIKDKVIGGEPM